MEISSFLTAQYERVLLSIADYTDQPVGYQTRFKLLIELKFSRFSDTNAHHAHLLHQIIKYFLFHFQIYNNLLLSPTAKQRKMLNNPVITRYVTVQRAHQPTQKQQGKLSLIFEYLNRTRSKHTCQHLFRIPRNDQGFDRLDFKRSICLHEEQKNVLLFFVKESNFHKKKQKKYLHFSLCSKANCLN